MYDTPDASFECLDCKLTFCIYYNLNTDLLKPVHCPLCMGTNLFDGGSNIIQELEDEIEDLESANRSLERTVEDLEHERDTLEDEVAGLEDENRILREVADAVHDN